MAKDQNKLNTYPMEELAPLMLEFLSEGKQVIITGRGNSMLPLIRNGKDRIKLAPCNPDELSCGDMILYKRNGGNYVIHRIIEILPDNSFIIKGDSQTWAEKGITTEQVFAKVTAVFRGEREISVKNKWYLLYARFWTKSRATRALYEAFLKLSLKIKSHICKK